MKIYTIGHSTHNQEEFIELLKHYDINSLIDVRSLPGSNYMPEYNKEAMEKWLPEANIDYKHMLNLGGLRKKDKSVSNELIKGWRNASFKNYAAYTLSDSYKEAVDELKATAKNNNVVIMCSEAVPWRCHRLLISNTLVNDDVRVEHIIGEKNSIEHKLGLYGAKPKIENNQIIYPKEESE